MASLQHAACYYAGLTNNNQLLYYYQLISVRRASISFSYYLQLQFFNRLRLRAGHYKIPAQQQAVNVVRNSQTLINSKNLMPNVPLNFNARLLTFISLIFSLTTICILIWINKQIATQFETASGKTRAMFGIIELTYSYKYFFTVGGIMAFILALFAIRKGETRIFSVFAIICAGVALTVVFLRMWTWIVSI